MPKYYVFVKETHKVIYEVEAERARDVPTLYNRGEKIFDELYDTQIHHIEMLKEINDPRD